MTVLDVTKQESAAPETSPAGASRAVPAAPVLREADASQALSEALIGSRTPIVSAEALKEALRTQLRLTGVRLGELLVRARLISRQQLEDALTIQSSNRGLRLGEILVSMGVVPVRAVQTALSVQLGIPHVGARKFEIEPAALRLVPGDFAVAHQVLPLLVMGESLVVAVENPLAMGFEQDLRFITGMPVAPAIGNPEEIRARLAREYLSGARQAALQTPHRHDLSQLKVEDLTDQLARETPVPVSATVEARVNDNTLVRLVDKIILEAHARGASDIHIETGPAPAKVRIRFRRDGDLEDYLELKPFYRSALVSRIKIMAGLDIAEHRHSQDGKIDCAPLGLPIEMRVVVVPTFDGCEDVVMRLLGGVEPLPLEKLGLLPHDLEGIKQMVSHSYGMILVCGPTGSGKTTTLHSILHRINSPDIKIWTAEDPIEISQAGLRQVQVNSRIGWTFAAAMRSFLRADPDVIMVGEMRDAETAKIGIEASLTGHLVFSTLHTNSAAESVVRLLDLGMDPFNFADALIGVLSQRLARRLCPHCKKARPATDAELHDLAAEYCAGTEIGRGSLLDHWHAQYGRDGTLFLHDPVGCNECRGGYRGRVGLFELLIATSEVKRHIRSRGIVPQIQQAAQLAGMRLLKQDALVKVLRGDLDFATARAASS